MELLLSEDDPRPSGFCGTREDAGGSDVGMELTVQALCLKEKLVLMDWVSGAARYILVGLVLGLVGKEGSF